MLNDLTIAQRLVIQKLTVRMLSYVDRLHIEALVEGARDVIVWKEFAMNASRCGGYQELGTMLPKLQNMILQCYINSDWLQHSLPVWEQQCEGTHSAESVELLTEELFNSVSWNEVNALLEESVRPTLSSQWKIWKQEVVKWFSTNAPAPSNDAGELSQCCDNSQPMYVLAGRKRPKLEVRRAEPHHSSPPAEISRTLKVRGKDTRTNSGNSEAAAAQEAESRPVIGSANNNRQCIAFVESKKRQCVRAANDGDVYCCVHLASRFAGATAAMEPSGVSADGSMCEGTTVVGTQCKHRALPSSSFCRKHRPQAGSQIGSSSVESRLERKHCMGSSIHGSASPCHGAPKHYSLYCENHVPSWLKRARNGRSRIISRDVFSDLVNGCSLQEQKIHLHQACELFCKLFRSVLSLRNPIPLEDQLQWALSEASRTHGVGDFLLELVCREKERLKQMWGFDAADVGGNACFSPRCTEESAAMPLPFNANSGHNSSHEEEKCSRCRICLAELLDGQELVSHWMDSHRGEVQQMFRGYACAICLDSFAVKRALQAHIQEQHHVPFVRQCMLLQCVACHSHFGSSGQLCLHALLVHAGEFKLPSNPDVSCHHQMMTRAELNLLNSNPTERYRCSTLKKWEGEVILDDTGGLGMISRLDVPGTLAKLSETQCSKVAAVLYARVQKTKSRPSNLDILAAAQATCCKLQLGASLEAKYGVLPESLYLKAAKLCSERHVQVEWHRMRFLCPRGCASFEDELSLPSLSSLADSCISKHPIGSAENENYGWELDECHVVLDWQHVRERSSRKVTVLCRDISFGKESVPIACLVEEHLLDSLRAMGDGSDSQLSSPWEAFTYITTALFDHSNVSNVESWQLACACQHSMCSPGSCDHVYLFDNDYEDAKDIYGNFMCGRFAYDGKRRIILEEGYLVYECNKLCSCNQSCTNRVLQNGLQVSLQLFRTENKGWAVRAGQPILHGMFVCEYIGEVIDEQEAIIRSKRYDEKCCSYMYRIDFHASDMSRMIDEKASRVIDATKFGNISRFINHSCSPNLVNYQVLIESMDSERAHIGLYAARDIASGEELTHNYRYELVPGNGHPCYCGASRCRGRLY